MAGVKIAIAVRCTEARARKVNKLELEIGRMFRRTTDC